MLAADRARKREDLLAATEKLLAPLIARIQAGRLQGAGEIGVEVGKVIRAYLVAVSAFPGEAILACGRPA